MECWICGGSHYQSDCPKKDTKGKGKGKKSDGKKGEKGKADGEKTKVPFPMDVHTETFKKVSVIIGEDGMAPCLHHIAMGSCPATDCPRSHDASKHKLTDKEKKSCKLELTRRANLREHRAKAKAKAKASAAVATNAEPKAKAKACPAFKKDGKCSAGKKCPYAH